MGRGRGLGPLPRKFFLYRPKGSVVRVSAIYSSDLTVIYSWIASRQPVV